jgi:peptidoglycan/xylan/chitin deacetylase (PgdA/CDA1 family)
VLDNRLVMPNGGLGRRPGTPTRALVVALFLAVTMAGCGHPAAGSTAGHATPHAPAPARTSAGFGATPSRPQATPAPKVPPGWVGQFKGQQVVIRYGHGAPISFTFDDGPSAQYTPQVLGLLAQHHVPAVFCLIGTQVSSYPALARDEVGRGHQLCDHSRDHDLRMNRKGKAYVDAEVDDGLAAIRAAAPGAPVSYYRQPGGLWDPEVVRAITRAHLHPLRWSDDPRDWSRPGSAVIVREVVRQVHPGAVILMHDGGGDRSQTVEALAWLLTALPAAGWRPVPAPKVNLSPIAAARPQ